MEWLSMIGPGLVGSSFAASVPGVAAAEAIGGTATIGSTSGLIGSGGAVTASGLLGASTAVGSIGSTIMSSLSQIQAGKQAEEVGKINAATLMEEGRAKRESAKYETLQLSKQRQQTIGSQIAGYGASGISMEGSPLEVMAETARNYERDIINMGYAGDVNATQLSNQAMISEWAGKQKKKAAWWGAGSELLTGLGAYGISRMGYSKRGSMF